MLSEATKGTVFMTQYLESMGIKVSYPIVVWVDNDGEILTSDNIMTTSHTMQAICLCWSGVIKIIFTKSQENDKDKNFNGELCHTHVNELIVEKLF